MDERIKVSVAMITYNHEAFIAEAIEGVLMQETDFPFELIIGEDFSTDRTRDIIGDYAKRYPGKIRLLLREHNVGPAKNYAETILSARGQYVAFLDGDDFWTAKDKLQRQADFLDEHPECSMCFHSVQWLMEDGTVMPTSIPKKKNSIYTLKDILQFNFISSLSTMTRGHCFRGFPDWHHATSGTVGDWVHHVLVASHGDIYYFDEDMGMRRVHSGGVFSAIDKVGRVEFSMRTLDLLDQELGFRYASDIKRSKASLYLNLAASQLRDGLRDEARESLALSVRTSPIGRQTLTWGMASVLIGIYLPMLAVPLRALKRKLRSGPQIDDPVP